MAWDDPSPRHRLARPAPRDPGDLGEPAADMQPGYGGLDRQGHGNDDATLGQLVGRASGARGTRGCAAAGSRAATASTPTGRRWSSRWRPA
jgi:hypothetical protein